MENDEENDLFVKCFSFKGKVSNDILMTLSVYFSDSFFLDWLCKKYILKNHRLENQI